METITFEYIYDEVNKFLKQYIKDDRLSINITIRTKNSQLSEDWSLVDSCIIITIKRMWLGYAKETITRYIHGMNSLRDVCEDISNFVNIIK